MGWFSGKKKEQPVRQLYGSESGILEEDFAESLQDTSDMQLPDTVAGSDVLSESDTSAASGVAAKASTDRKQQVLEPVLVEEQKGELLNEVLDYFITNEGKMLARMRSGNPEISEKTKEEILKKAREQFKSRQMAETALEDMLDRFSRYMWGYYVLDPLIEDRGIFDIKCFSDKHIRIKRMGSRMDAPDDLGFASSADYVRFVRMVATKNQINLSVINALTTFTDKESSPDFILRFNISTEHVTSSGLPRLHIRKIPKFKYSMAELVDLGFMTDEERRYFEAKVPDCGGILFTGSGGSGKTNFMNSLLELYPHDRSALVIQENEELFSYTHPDMSFEHVVTANGEGKVSYTLEDLARQGLLDDIDLFVVGEIKGREAGAFSMCSYTGAQAWCSCHGKNEMEAIYKLADYVKIATGYSLRESLKMLSGLEIVVYLKDFHIEGISEIRGWDYDRDTLVVEKKSFSKETEKKSGQKTVQRQDVSDKNLLKSLSEYIFP